MSFGDPPFQVITTTTNHTNWPPLPGSIYPVPDLAQMQALGQLNAASFPGFQPQNFPPQQRLWALPSNPKLGDKVSLWFDGTQWVRLSDEPFVWKTPDARGSRFSLEELTEASDMINEMEHGRRA